MTMALRPQMICTNTYWMILVLRFCLLLHLVFDKEYLAGRLAYVDFQDPLEKVKFDLSVDCPNVVEGIDQICNWISYI